MEWIECLLNQYGKLKLAQDAKDLEDSRKLLATDREAVRAHQRRTHGEHFRENAQDDGEGMIHIGDQHQYYRMQEPKQSGTGTLLKLALAGALLGSGVGSGFGAAMLLDVLRSQPVAPAPDHVDRDTRYELRLGKAE